MRLVKTALIIILSALSVSLAGCAHHSPRTELTQENIQKKTIIIGHRGARDLAPENTMAAFDSALKYADSFELDTMLCSTGEAVVIHDYTLERTTSGKGKVSETPLDELKKLDAGSHFSEKFKGEKIPLLSEVLDRYHGKILINIEIKTEQSGEPLVKLIKEIVKLLDDRNIKEGVMVTSFNPYALEEIKKIRPALIRGQIYSDFADTDLAWHKKFILKNLLMNSKADPDVLVPDDVLVDKDYIEKMHKRGYRIFPYTVNDPERMSELINAGIDGIITDRPDLMKQILEARK